MELKFFGGWGYIFYGNRVFFLLILAVSHRFTQIFNAESVSSLLVTMTTPGHGEEAVMCIWVLVQSWPVFSPEDNMNTVLPYVT